MPRFIVYAGNFSYYCAVLEYFIIEFQIKALVEMIHHLTEQNFLFVFLFPYSSLVSTYLYFITLPTAIN